MDVANASVSSLTPASAPTSTPALRTSPRRNRVSPKRSLRESQRLKHVSPKSAAPAGKVGPVSVKPSQKTSRTTQASSRPLVPLTERKSHDDKSPRAKNDTEADRWEVAPDGGSAGREGRQFTVANVGNNGRIYLRPTIRPAHQRYPQPNFTFPATPPSTAGLEAFGQVSPGLEGGSDIFQSQWTPTPRPSPAAYQTADPSDPVPPQRPTRHRRALSDSTLHDGGGGAAEFEAGAFKVVISKPGDEKRPKTTEDASANALPHLDINIPSWRIGVPRFTAAGTPLIRGSSYAASFAQSDEMQSANGSALHRSQKDYGISLPTLGPRRPSTLRVPQARLSRSTKQRSLGPASPKTPKANKGPRPLRSTFLSTHPVIEPSMFDDLTFRPECDDRSIVRYAPTTGAITAATPPRLVAEITSPSFLDYELISDFFLTFRAFLDPGELLRMLVARLRWAAARNDEIGMIVHVRAFVALRHWILNYFVDDFFVDYHFRLEFCKLLNVLVEDLAGDKQDRRVQLKTLSELKKCWRRVCARYWDGLGLDDTANVETPITPGGAAGNRDSVLSPLSFGREEGDLPVMGSLLPVPESTVTNFDIAPPLAGPPAHQQERPSTPEDQQRGSMDNDLGPWSPTSLASLDIVSCSFPSKHVRALQPNISHPLAAHPVSATSIQHNGPVATTPKALVGKRVRPTQRHQRSSSLPELPEEEKLERPSVKDQDFATGPKYAGSLVRGEFLPPAQAFVELYSSQSSRQTTIFHPQEEPLGTQDGRGNAMSGHGMRRLIGSVRRALSTRGPATSPSQAQFMGSVHVGGSGTAMTRLPGTAVVPQHLSTDGVGGRSPLRIDLLGATVAEDFKRAIREDASIDENGASDVQREDPVNTSVPYLDSTKLDGPPMRIRPSSEGGLTGGSKSIVIVDDTLPPESSNTTLPTANPSVEAFGDALLPNTANITPPMTPPTNQREMARRSSHLLNENIRSSVPSESLPPFVPDLATLEGRSTGPPSDDGHHNLHVASQRSIRRPPLSDGMARMHKRNKSSRTRHSFNSTIRRHGESVSSDMIPPSTVQSLDATTFTRYSACEDEADTDLPKPLRVLRRRPGGDLRAATNVDELDRHELRRSYSMGSLANYTESLRSSTMYSHRRNSMENIDSTVSDSQQRRAAAFSVGQLADKPAARELSLCSTRASKPPMRPSFEAEAKRLAQIPDDDDDGGVESALLKLEGKFDRIVPKLSMDLRQEQNGANSEEEIDDEMTSVEGRDYDDYLEDDQYSRGALTEESQSAHGDDAHRVASVSGSNSNMLDVPRASTVRQQSFLSDASRESYSSTPLLDGGLTDDGHSRRETKNWTDRSVLQDEEDDVSPAQLTEVDGSRQLSFDFVDKTDSMGRIQPGATAPPSFEDQSFLDSDLSSELSADGALEETEANATASPVRDRLPAHPLGGAETTTKTGLPSPVNSQNLGLDSCATKTISQSGSAAQGELNSKPLPPTPAATPWLPAGLRSPTDPKRRGADASKKFSVHLPFILAFDSDILAQQLTLIEKDALNEIDWKELVDMDWKHATDQNSRSWVDFLRKSDAQGVEVVIARFNLVVKWAISEIVLTQNIEERARCLIKYIHIASHCRRYRNFATLAQLTIALSSNEISRLARTWELVPSKDLKTLRELESLVTPMRNFFNLRAEMESGPDVGCIPFVGIYTHDLLYNAQRPSEIASSPSTAPLVNFERCRIGAAVVKTLLRLLEASARYSFQPLEGVTERCLWIGALSDDEIRRHSGNLE